MGGITSQIIQFLVIILLSSGRGLEGTRTTLGNKRAVKTIHSDGDVIDCVDIYKQPAFDHPLLKNHTIQMRPSWYLNDASAEHKISRDERAVSFQVWNKFEKCPEETIPIRRTQRNDNVVSDFVRDFVEKGTEEIPFPKKEKYGDQHAEYAGMFASKKDFYGAIQAVSAWTPQVEVPTEFSAASTWLVNNEGTETNVVGAGWMVNPSLFGDNLTRLFVSWNKVGSQTTGCYNLFCSGFIQTDKNVVLGAYLKPITVPGGTEYFLHYNIIKDKNTGNWWFSAENLSIGYWPASMFTNLQVARRVVWAGQVLNTKPGGHHTATKMGNGIFPDEKQEAAIFKDLEVVDADGKWAGPIGVAAFQDNRGCYDSKSTTFSLINAFHFGGPGRSSTCM
ncbi:hypothetical protein AMTRI_Chr06g171100 [Amborella trichopoda]